MGGLAARAADRRCVLFPNGTIARGVMARSPIWASDIPVIMRCE